MFCSKNAELRIYFRSNTRLAPTRNHSSPFRHRPKPLCGVNKTIKVKELQILYVRYDKS